MIKAMMAMEASSSSHIKPVPPEWTAIKAYLSLSAPNAEIDEYIDELAEYVFQVPDTPHATQALIVAFNLAQNTLTRRSVAFALAFSADWNSEEAVDTLLGAYRTRSDDQFLSASFLEATSYLATHNPLARAELLAALLRLNLNAPRYLLIQSAKIIGRMSNVQFSTDLRTKLEQFCAIPDLAVQAEAYYQLGLIDLAAALLANDHLKLESHLLGAEEFFRQSEMCEEVRYDATLFRLLIGATFILHSLRTDSEDMIRQSHREINQIQANLQTVVANVGNMYRSRTSELIIVRVLSIVDALQRVFSSISYVETWTNFDEVLIDLATIYTLLSSYSATSGVASNLDAAFNMISERILLPKLGLVVVRAVGRRRLARVIERYSADPAQDVAVTRSLQALEQAAMLSELEPTDDFSSLNERLDILAKRLGTTPSEVMQNFTKAVDNNSVDRWAETLGFPAPTLPIDNPGLFDADPTVHRAARKLLEYIRAQLIEYPHQCWNRLIETVVRLVKFVHFVRDDMPNYTICSNDNGKGQEASERDLQEDLFGRLRLHYGRGATYEQARIGGGRPDTGLKFRECFFPIEVKHEFNSIEQQKVFENYLNQTDIYAAATDRVAFLFILDLRAVNAAGHVSNVKKRKRQNESSQAVALYSLEDSFWVDALPRDPQLPHMQSKAVIIGLVPGNRPRPSSTTTYSRRPATKHMQVDE